MRAAPLTRRPGRVALVDVDDHGGRVGFLGAFTTFSTFGYETFSLLRADRAAAASGYVALSVIGGMAAIALGYAAGRHHGVALYG